MAVNLSRLKQSRQTDTEVGGYRFTLERPTQYEVASAGGLLRADLDFVARHIVGWNLKEADLVPGGDPEPAEFDAEVCALWLADQPDLWRPLAQALRDAFVAYEEGRAAKGKA